MYKIINFTKFVKRILDFINHYIVVVVKKKITVIIVFTTEKVAQHVNVTSHTRW